ncbi:unnamed protein product, partial [Prorocentrum cordatum]
EVGDTRGRSWASILSADAAGVARLLGDAFDVAARGSWRPGGAFDVAPGNAAGLGRALQGTGASMPDCGRATWGTGASAPDCGRALRGVVVSEAIGVVASARARGGAAWQGGSSQAPPSRPSAAGALLDEAGGGGSHQPRRSNGACQALPSCAAAGVAPTEGAARVGAGADGCPFGTRGAD